MTNNLRWLSGDELRMHLIDGNAEVFRYRRNTSFFTFLTVIATACGVGAGWVYTHELRTYGSIGLFSVLLATAITILILIVYWTWFVNVHFLAVTRHELLVGRSYQAWSLAWKGLDVQRLGFGTPDGPARGVLRVRIDGRTVRVHLFNPFAYVDDLEGFMFQLLSRLRDGSDEQS